MLAEEIGERLRAVDRARIVTGPDDRENAVSGGHHHGSIAHREENLLQRIGPGEVTRNRIRNKQGMVADLRLAVGVEGFLEDANDDKRYAFDADGFADGCVCGAIELFCERLDDDGDLVVGPLILVVEEAAGYNDKIAHDPILRRDAKQHGLPW